MRAAVLLLLLAAGCPTDPGSAECTKDSDCAPDLCTRAEQCAAPSDIRSVKITWTIGGNPASASSCASMPDLFVEVVGDTPVEQIAFAPVPCDQGVFNFDKLPTSYGIAELGIDGAGTGDQVAIDASNAAHFDLFP